jgi:hypothetical protein
MNARLPLALTVCAVAVSSMMSLGCGGDEDVYPMRPAVSGKTPSLPAVPTLPNKPKKQGDAYTIWGITHDLRSRVHAEDVLNKKVTIIGYVVKTNYATAPKCAIHKTGKGDPADCKAPIPTFSIADDAGETKDMIDVMGWASNFAQLFSLLEGIKKAPKGKELEVKLKDEFWANDIPNPIPNLGAQVKVTGTYATTFTKATGGAASNPKYGILTVEKIEYVTPPKDPAVLPFMDTKK